MQRGVVLVDGVPVPHIQHAWLHSQVRLCNSTSRLLPSLYTGLQGWSPMRLCHREVSDIFEVFW